jgi:GNAT superfamily N-acetyltransferase
VPHLKWIKAVLIPSRQTIGIACWTVPGAPIFNHFLRSAADEFGWRAQMGWSDADMEEMWASISDAAWNGQFVDDDNLRRSVLGDEPHWFLAPLLTWPEFQGRGVGKKLMDWAIEQADAQDPPTAMYLESAPTARAVYMHCGFEPVGKYNFVRRGPKVVRPEDYEDVVNGTEGGVNGEESKVRGE